MSYVNLEIEQSKHKVTNNGLDLKIGANTDTLLSNTEFCIKSRDASNSTECV